MSEKVVGYQLDIRNTSQAAAAVDTVANKLKEAVEVAKQLEQAMNNALKGGTGTATLDADLAKVQKRISEINKQLTNGKQQGLKITDNKSNKEGIKSLEQIVGAIRELGGETGDRAKELRELNKILKSGAAEGTDVYGDLVARVAELKEEQRAVNEDIREQQRELRQVGEAEGSYKAINAQLVSLRNEYRQLSAAERETSTELLERIAALDKELKDIDEDMGIYVRNVGNYFGSFVEGLEDIPGPLGGVAGGIKGLTSQFKALLANPVVLTLAIIAGALKILFDAFKRSERGAELFNKAGALMDATLSLLTNAVNQLVDFFLSLGDTIGKVFSDPIGALEEFGQAIIDNVTVRIQGLMEFVVSLGDIVGNVLSGDFDKAGDAMEKAALSGAQFVSGVDAQKIAEATAEVNRQAEAFLALDEARRRIVTTNKELELQAERLNAAEELSTAIADDATLSFAERAAAAERARDLVISSAQTEAQIAQNNLGIIQQELALRSANGEQVVELRQAEIDALREVVSAEAALTLAVRDNEQQRRELRQDELERNLDFLLDNFDNVKTINEQIIANGELTATQQQALLDETIALGTQSFDEQIKIFEQFAEQSIDANALLAESDSQALIERTRALGLSEIIEGRLLEVVRDRRTAIQDLTTAQSEVDQAFEAENAQEVANRFDQLIALENIKVEERVQTRAAANVRIQELEIARAQEELDTLDLTSQQRLEKERELSIARAELVNSRYDRDIEAVEQGAQREQQAITEQFAQRQLLVEQQFAAEQITRKQREEQLRIINDERDLATLTSEQALAQDRLAINELYGINVIGAQAELAAAEVALNEEKNNQLLESDERINALRIRTQESTLQSLGSLFQSAQTLLEGDEEAKKKYARVIKGLAIGEIALNLVREISQINASFAANADITQTTRALLVAAAVARSIVATVQVTRQEFEQGGAAPIGDVQEGVVQGPSHAGGGVDIQGPGGAIYNVEGQEMILKNGPEMYVINKRATRKHFGLLNSLRGNTNIYSPAKRVIASAINSSTGGIAFADGGLIPIPFDPIEAPLPPSSTQPVFVEGTTQASTSTTTNVGLARQAPVSRKPAKVIANAAEIYKEGKKRAQATRGLSI